MIFAFGGRRRVVGGDSCLRRDCNLDAAGGFGIVAGDLSWGRSADGGGFAEQIVVGVGGGELVVLFDNFVGQVDNFVARFENFVAHFDNFSKPDVLFELVVGVAFVSLA